MVWVGGVVYSQRFRWSGGKDSYSFEGLPTHKGLDGLGGEGGCLLTEV